ncbi:GyrI-like domain-containing protein [Microbacterium sp. NPDC064584]|uniref:GyrI-like domain-containing protein n=1 Tax=Microbacterium sp. NPDC064584 TaxID=3155817 RepID=UPI003424298C
MKVDLKKDIVGYRARTGVFDTVDVPPLRFLMIDGRGDPNGPVFGEALTALYSIAYPLKFLSKKELDRDYVVMPLEALWWAEDMQSFTAARDKSAWEWTAMILTPDWITAEQFAGARAKAASAAAERVRLETLSEGRCVQTLHVGSFDSEGPVLQKLHAEVIPSRGLRMTGRHHEIYLSDPRRADPSKLRTILRQPVSDAAN